MTDFVGRSLKLRLSVCANTANAPCRRWPR